MFLFSDGDRTGFRWTASKLRGKGVPHPCRAEKGKGDAQVGD